MKVKNINNLPEPDNISGTDNILLSRGGEIVRMALAKFRKYIGFSTGAELLGLPEPTEEDIGKVPMVNNDGTGYGLRLVGANLLWSNSNVTSSFAAQTVTHDNKKYNFFVVFFIRSTTHDDDSLGVSLVVKNGEIHDMQLYDTTTSGIVAYYRKVSANDNGFVFETGKYNIFDGKTTHNVTSSGNYAVPVAIYGIG